MKIDFAPLLTVALVIGSWAIISLILTIVVRILEYSFGIQTGF